MGVGAAASGGSGQERLPVLLPRRETQEQATFGEAKCGATKVCHMMPRYLKVRGPCSCSATQPLPVPDCRSFTFYFYSALGSLSGFLSPADLRPTCGCLGLC